MNIVIPMAGKGERFTHSKFSLPKPLIPVAGKAMYRHAVDSLPLSLATNLLFILKQNDFTHAIHQDINFNYGALYPCTIVVLKDPTRGQAETILKAESFFDLTVSTLIHNCDTGVDFDWAILQPKSEGALVLFNSEEERWSYARVDLTTSQVLQVQEKKVISCHASSGTYFFKDTRILLKDIQTLIKKNIRENNEFYLSSVFNLMIQREQFIQALWSKATLCFGTPVDLVESLNIMMINLKKD